MQMIFVVPHVKFVTVKQCQCCQLCPHFRGQFVLGGQDTVGAKLMILCSLQ